MNITWVLSGAEPTSGERLTSLRASTRYRGLIPAEVLRARGHRVDIVQSDRLGSPDGVSDAAFGDAVVFAKSFHAVDSELARRARALGRLVVCDFCDLDFTRNKELFDHRRALAASAHRLVACSDMLATLVAEALDTPPPLVIPDPFEGPHGEPKFAPEPGRLRLAWFGHESSVHDVLGLIDPLARAVGDTLFSLVVVTGPIDGIEEAFAQASRKFAPKLTITLVPWSVEATWRSLGECDLVVLPVRTDGRTGAKSSNRAVESLRAGRMVAASPMDAYKVFADHIELDPDVVTAVQRVAADPQRAARRLRAGQNLVERDYSPQAIGTLWEDLLTRGI